MVRRAKLPVRHIDPSSTEGRAIVAKADELSQRLLVMKRLALGNPKPEDIRLVPSERPEEVVTVKQNFKTWLAVYFVERGSFRLTDNGLDALSQRTQMATEFLEDNSTRDRDERVIGTVAVSKKDRKEAAMAAASLAIEEGRAAELVERGYVKHVGAWKELSVRVEVVRKFVETVGKNITEITQRDFNNSYLGGLLGEHYIGSPYSAFVEAGFAWSFEDTLAQAKTNSFQKSEESKKIYPWEMENAPQEYGRAEVRIAATKWLVWKSGKSVGLLNQKDFETNVRGVLPYCQSSPYLALVEAGFAWSFDDVISQAQTSSFQRFENSVKLYPWEMKKAPNEYHRSEVRIAVTKWVVWRLQKPAKEVTHADFDLFGLGAVKVSGHVYLTLLEAGLVTEADEKYIRSKHHTHRFE